MAFKDIAGVVALIGVVFTSGVVFTKMTSDIENLKKEVVSLKSDGPTWAKEIHKGNILLKIQEVECPTGWEELGKTSMIIEPGARVSFERYTKIRGARNSWPAIDFEMCIKK